MSENPKHVAMKYFFQAIAGLALFSSVAQAQSYEAQYPYDPYSGSPQQSYVQQPASSYQGYSNPSYSSGGYGGYDKQGYNYGSSGGVAGSMLTWGSLSAHYAYNDFSGDDRLEGDSGFGIDLHAKLMKPIYLHFGLDRITSSDPQARSLEITSFTAGIGAYVPIGSRFQIFGEVGVRYDYTTGELEYINADDVGVYVRPGVRFAVTPKFELSASLLFNNTDNLNERVVEVSGYYAILPFLDIGGGVDFGTDINTFRIGGRWRWD